MNKCLTGQCLDVESLQNNPQRNWNKHFNFIRIKTWQSFHCSKKNHCTFLMRKLINVRGDLKLRGSPANGTHERKSSRQKWQKQLSLKTNMHGILESWKNQAGKDRLILVIFSHNGDCQTSDPSHGGMVPSRNTSDTECCTESTWTFPDHLLWNLFEPKLSQIHRAEHEIQKAACNLLTEANPKHLFPTSNRIFSPLFLKGDRHWCSFSDLC